MDVMKENRKIIHLDMDAFFAAIEERDNPKLRGKPVIVGAYPGDRGVVSTCNYIAREYGVHSAMSSAEAYRRCPHAVFVKSHFSKYIYASNQVRSIMSDYTDKIEFVSLDEGYMDVTGSELIFGSAENIAKELTRYHSVKRSTLAHLVTESSVSLEHDKRALSLRGKLKRRRADLLNGIKNKLIVGGIR